MGVVVDKCSFRDPCGKVVDPFKPGIPKRACRVRITISLQHAVAAHKVARVHDLLEA
jgi:hypothetical protein